VPIQAVTVRMRRELEENKDRNGKVEAATDKPMTSQEREKAKEELQGIFQIQKGRAVFVPIESGIMGSTDLEVLKGVEPGDEIVTGTFSVLRTLKNGTKVKIDNSPKTTPVAPGA
jgi:HlyD family secretion protein